MRCLPRSDRTAGAPKWTLHIFLTLVGVLMLLSDPVQSQQEEQEQTPPGKCSLSEQELDSLIVLLNTIEQQPNSTERDMDYAEESDEEADAETRIAARCARELKQLREAIDELQRSYYDFKKNANPLSPGFYRFWHNRYAEYKEKVTIWMEHVIKQVRPQDQLQSKKLRDKFDAVDKQMNETVSKIAMQGKQK